MVWAGAVKVKSEVMTPFLFCLAIISDRANGAIDVYKIIISGSGGETRC